MKKLNFGNLAIIISLIISLLLSQFNSNFVMIPFIIGLYILPLYQLLIGLIWLGDTKENKKIKYYFLGVLSYFLLMFCFSSLHNILDNQKLIENIVSIFGISIPIILALYFTYILNQYAREKNQ